MGIINKVKKFSKNHLADFCNFYKPKRSTAFLVVLIVILGVFFFPNVVFAESFLSGMAGELATFVTWVIFTITGWLQSMTIWFLELFIQVAGYNNFVNENVVQLGWTMVRDVANMFFIVALLVIAFANILGMENYEMKTTLPKLFLMAILVNFSKLIAGIVIDAAHVFTMTFLNAISASAGGNLVGAFGMDEIWGLSDKKFEQLETQALLSSIYSLVITLAVAITMFSYFAIMLVRMVALWVLIILSPLAFIAAVLPKTDSITEKWRKKFTNQVMVAPVMVFFLWLAFATMGTGDIGRKIIDESTVKRGGEVAKLDNVSNKMASWDKFLSFIVAVTF
ncbi:MAG: type IV secretion system protein, partial [Candidatus Magasanikbacteria bacterium]